MRRRRQTERVDIQLRESSERETDREGETDRQTERVDIQLRESSEKETDREG